MNKYRLYIRGSLALLLVLGVMTPSAMADTLFYDGFESGGYSAGGWIVSGASIDYLVKYAGVFSAKLDRTDSIIRIVNTTGYEDIVWTYYRGINGYEWWQGDDVIFQYTTDFGASWQTLEAPGNNSGWTFKAFALPAAANNNPNFAIRVLSSAGSDDYCWVDEVNVTGTLIRYTLSTSVTGSGSITLDPTQPQGGYLPGTQVTVTANPDTGYYLHHWSGNLSGSTNPTTITMDGDKSVTANFAKEEYSVDVSTVGPGSVTKDPAGPYNYGDSVTLTATPDSGDYFNGWSDDISGYDNPKVVTVYSDMDVTATFTDGAPPLTSSQEQWLTDMSYGTENIWPNLTPPQALALYDRAEEQLSLTSTYNVVYGQVVSRWWNGYDRSGPGMYETAGDSALWTGHYLAALCAKWEITRDQATKDEIWDVLEAYQMLTLVGRDGVLVRFAAPYDDAAFLPHNENYGGGVYWGTDSWTNYKWLGYPSRDTYYGFALGMAMTYHVFDGEDSSITNYVANLVVRVVDRLRGDDWWIDDGEGHITNPLPFWKCVFYRLAKTTANSYYGTMLDAGYNDAFLQASIIPPASESKYADEYYPANLTFVGLMVVNLFETDATKKAHYEAWLKDAFEDESMDHLNAAFAAHYCWGRWDVDRQGARGAAQGALYDMPGPVRWMEEVDSSALYPHYDATKSTIALFPRHRPTDDYIWQKTPTLMLGGADVPWEYPGVDLLLPYWMGRVVGVVPAP